MPKPYIFQSEAELISKLGAASTSALAEEYFSATNLSIHEVVHQGVSSNTYRAFRNLPVRPSETFRNWTIKHIEASLHELQDIADDAAYADYVHRATVLLEHEWERQTGTAIGYGRGAKLLNLVFKKLACLDTMLAASKEKLISLQHVPLDSFTIVGLRDVFPEMKIPKTATMKYIESKGEYDSFQERIAGIARKAGVPAIYYDVLAWDMAH